MKKVFRILCLLLVLALLAGCAAPSDSTADSGTAGSGTVTGEESRMTYAERLSLFCQKWEGGLLEHINWSFTHGITAQGQLWALGAWNDREHPEQTKNDLLALFDADNRDVSCLQLQLPEPAWQLQEAECDSASVADILSKADGTLCALLHEARYDWPAADDGQQYLQDRTTLEARYSLCTLAQDGTLQRTAVLQLPEELAARQADMVTYLPGTAFWDSEDHFWMPLSVTPESAEHPGQYDFKDGSTWLLRFAAQSGACETVVPLSDSQSCMRPVRPTPQSVLYPNWSQCVTVDGLLSTRPAVSATPLPDALQNELPRGVIQNGDADLLLWDLHGIWQLEKELQGAERLVDWQDYELQNAQILDVLALDGEQFLVFTMADGALEIYRIKRMDDALSLDKPILTLGVTQDPDRSLQKAADSYNYTDPAFYIQTVDYSDEAAQQKGFDDARAMLADDILHGTAPDMLQYSAAFLGGQLVRQGFFADLYPYLDADAQLSRDDILPGLRAGIETDGALPLLPVDFGLTLNAVKAGAADIADASWRTDAFRAACDALPELETPLYGYSRMDLVLQQVFTGDAFLDIAAGRCNMDSPAFCTLLEDSAALPPQRPDGMTDPKPLFADGKALAYNQYFGSFAQLQTVRYVLDGDFDFVGLPTDAGSGRALSPGMQLGIARTCQDPDAAWAFLRTLLLPDFQDALTAGFPAGTAALSRRAAAVTQSRPQSGTHSTSYLPPYLQQVSLTQEQQAYWDGHAEAADVQKLLTVIRNTDTLYQYDSVVANIVIEEAEAFYNGQRSAEETAEIIQNRVQTYLDEQG